MESPLIQSEASLVIEGLDIQCGPAEPHAFLPPSVLFVRRAPMRLANCRVLHRGAGPAIRVEDPTMCEVRNSLLYCTQSAAMDCVASGRVRVLVENCVFSGFSGCTVHQVSPAAGVSLDLRHNAQVLHEAIRVHLDLAIREQGKGNGRAFLHIATSRNLFDTDGSLLTFQSDRHNAAETERIARASRGEMGRTPPRGGERPKSHPEVRSLPTSRRPFLGRTSRTCTAAREHSWPWFPAKVRKGSARWAFRATWLNGTSIGEFLRPGSPGWPTDHSTASRCGARPPLLRSHSGPPITAVCFLCEGHGTPWNRDSKGRIPRWSDQAKLTPHGRIRSTIALGWNCFV